MPELFHVVVPAFDRVAADLHRLGYELKGSETPSVTMPPDPAVDMPSLKAVRPVTAETLPDLRDTVANRFIEVGLLLRQAITRFQDLDDDRAAGIIGLAGSLLPPED